jgi:tripartite-type tricarboxylate transporter receptor subunit TctC
MKRLLMVLLIGSFVLSGIFFGFTAPVSAAEYPNKDIRLIIGAKPGGGFDTYSRAIGRYIKKYLPDGVNLIVENRPGAAHKIGITMVYNSKPDGYTIGKPMMPGLYFPQMFEEQKYDMTKVTWLATLLHEPRVISIASGSKYKTLKDLQQAESVKFSIVGFSSETGVIMSIDKLGIKASYISGHKNSKAAVLSAIRGDADAVGFTYGSLRKFYASKQLTPVLVLGSKERIKTIPDVPTIGEFGHDELNNILGNFRVLAGPPNMPPEVTRYLRDALWKTLNDKEFLAWSKEAKRPVKPLNGEDTEKMMNRVMSDYSKYKDALKKYVK